MGKVGRGVKCSVDGCGAEAERSLSRDKISGFKVVGEGRRVYLCSQHYKAWKKATKKERELDRIRFA